MILFATKISVKKVLVGLVALGAVVWGVSALTPRAAETVSTEPPAVAQRLKTNDERIAYLKSFGWEVEPQPVIALEVQIPAEFDAAYETYNALQQRQGLDLTKCRGKRAMLYTYRLTNYPSDEEGVTASLVLYKNRVIAADISSPEVEGFIHGVNEQPAAGK